MKYFLKKNLKAVSLLVVTSVIIIGGIHIINNHNKVLPSIKITFLAGTRDFMATEEVVITDLLAIEYINSSISSAAKEILMDVDNNSVKQYKIEFIDKKKGYSRVLYYNTLSGRVCIAENDVLREMELDLGRYVDSFFQNEDIVFLGKKDPAVVFFKNYGWTLDYKIASYPVSFGDLDNLQSFDMNEYYFAYNNELSKDIGLDMGEYSDEKSITIEIHRIREALPDNFYPQIDCRGILVKSKSKIIGAFISAGSHRLFTACSLKGNSFEEITGYTLSEWIAEKIIPDSIDERLSKLTPEKIVEEYFSAIGKNDTESALRCVSAGTLCEYLTMNISNNELYNKELFDSAVFLLPIIDSEYPADLKDYGTTILTGISLYDESEKNIKTFFVEGIFQTTYNDEKIDGNLRMKCSLIYESTQIGWKIVSFSD